VPRSLRPLELTKIGHGGGDAHPLHHVVLAAAVAALVLTSTAAASSRSTTCPGVTSVKWTTPYTPSKSGTHYDVSVSGKAYTCAQAEASVKKLATHEATGSFPTVVAGGPTGWTCTASKSKTGLAYTGTCDPKSSNGFNGPSFSWTVG
jgi:hypothetical protein